MMGALGSASAGLLLPPTSRAGVPGGAVEPASAGHLKDSSSEVAEGRKRKGEEGEEAEAEAPAAAGCAGGGEPTGHVGRDVRWSKPGPCPMTPLVLLRTCSSKQWGSGNLVGAAHSPQQQWGRGNLRLRF